MSLCILTYHAVIQSPLKVPDWCFLDLQFFREQMRYLKNNFNVIPLSEAPRHMREDKSDRPSIVLTFDDGFRNNYEFVFPILYEEELPATIFVVTELIGTDNTVWFCRLNDAFARTTLSSLKWKHLQLNFDTPEEKARASSQLQKQLKQFPQAQLFQELNEIVRNLGVDPDSKIDKDSPFCILDRKEIEEMTATGIIEIGSHTQSHAILSLLNAAERQREIRESFAAVHDLIGHPCKFFAYPNGQAQDYDAQSIQILQDIGVDCAVTSIEGLNRSDTSAMELRRFGIGPHMNMDDFTSIVRLRD